jgi:hypothetical protein
MRGATAVVAFGVFGLLAILLILQVSHLDGWCGEKPLGGCTNFYRADPEYVVGLVARGILGLVAIAVAGNGISMVLRHLRSER